MDVSGEHQLDIAHSVFKQRMTLDGKYIEEEPEQYQVVGEEEEEDETAVAVNKEKCGRYVLWYYESCAVCESTFDVAVAMVQRPGNSLAAIRVRR